MPLRSADAAQVAEAPEGAQGATADIAKAYRTIPVHPDHKRLIVVQHPPGWFHLDHVLPFGMTSASGMQGEPTDAFIDMLELEGIPSTKWIDDCTHRRDPTGRDEAGAFAFAYDLDEMHRRFEPLGFPWHETKFADFAEEVVYVGFLWSYRDKTVALPERKREKYLEKTRTFLDAARARRVVLRDVYSIIGTLSHIAFVFREGRAFLPALSKCAADYRGNLWQERWLSHRALSDLAWWADILAQPRPGRSLKPKGPPVDLGVWVDASEAWGIGVFFDGKWDAWRLRNGWKSDGRDIG